MTRYIFILSIALSLCSCSAINVSDEKHQDDFYADIASETKSKTILGDENDGRYPVLWENGDRITIYGNDGNGSIYVTDNDLTSNARFRYDASLEENPRLEISQNYYACYPSSMWMSRGRILFPSVQHFRSHNIGKGAMPMISVSEGRKLSFSGICGILSLSVPGITSRKISSVRICSNRDIGGITGIDISLSGNVVWESLKRDDFTAGRPLVLDCSDRGGVNSEDFLLVIPALTFERMTFQLCTSTDSVLTYFLPGSVTFQRNKISRYTLPTDVFSDAVPIINEGEPFYPLTSLEYTLDSQVISSDTTMVTSIRTERFTDGTEYLQLISYDISVSSDDGSSFNPDIHSVFNVFKTEPTENGFLIIHGIPSSDCIVLIRQRISGKELRLSFSG